MIGIWLGVFALVMICLPPSFDPAIYIKERQASWTWRSPMRPALGFVVAGVIATFVIQFV